MCICGGIGEAAVAGAVIIALKKGGVMKKVTLVLPTLAELVGKVRRGVRPGQVFKDKRRKTRAEARRLYLQALDEVNR